MSSSGSTSASIGFPPPEPGDALRVSATLFVAYGRCPSSALGRLEGRYPPDSPRSFTGALTHRLIRRHLEQGPIEDGAIDQACREEIGTALNGKMAAIGVRTPSGLRPLIEQAGDLYRRFRSFPGEGFQGAEVELSVSPAEGVDLVGRVDAVFRRDDGLVLVDWKTGGLGEPDDQLAFYALVWTLEKGEPPARVEAVSIGTGERTDAVPGLAELEEVAGRVSSMVTAIRRAWSTEASLPLLAGPWCRSCGSLDGCPEGAASLRLLERSPLPPRDAVPGPLA